MEHSKCTRALLGLLLAVQWTIAPAHAGRIILKDGTVLEGDIRRLGTLIANPTEGQNPGSGGELIVLVDDHLRRVYVSLHRVQQVIDNAGEGTTKFEIPQPVAQGGRQVAALGRVLKTDPWDDHGRRTIKLLIKGGPTDVIQGITLVTPRYFQVQTLSAGQRLLIDQRYATSNLPTAKLRAILYNSLREKLDDPDQRLRIYRLFLEADRYKDAEEELKILIEKYPDLELDRQLQAVRNLQARLGLQELKYRREAGQHRFAEAILAKFPTEDIAGETLLEVREILQQYRSVEKKIEDLQTDLTARLAEVPDDSLRDQITPITQEMCGEVNSHTLVRFSAYLRLTEDDSLSPSQKLALAISGWLIGSDDATDNLPVAISLVEVRRLVAQYLTEETKPQRSEIVTRIRSQEGGIPRLVAKILSHMKPPLQLPDPIEGVPGFYRLRVPSRERLPDVNYLVQLPPEYDPYRRYPAIVTLHGAGTTAQHQVDWWAGGIGANQKMRRGQGTRHGYIVIAPEWAKVKQQKYEYTGREHAAALDTLRDACRRFAIDTDRVFLSGHSMGGDAAWDIGLSHPDLWAGVMPIVATADSNKFTYNTLYWRNAKYVPFYFVGGALDGNKMVKNAYQFDRYLRHLGYDVLISEFHGRGHESFYDEVLKLFDWMKRQRRDFFPKDFTGQTIRSWDNYFWWVEINEMPRHMVGDPENWPPRRIKTLSVSGKINATEDGTTVRVSSGRVPTTVWLAPELVDFDKRIRLVVTGFRSTNGPKPDIAVMLEDARTRGDRLHPFWARMDVPGGG